MAEHRSGAIKGFTQKYGIELLVWFEVHSYVEAAILREKRIKGWNRAWKIRMIEAGNIGWSDLAEELGLEPLDTVTPAKPGAQLGNGTHAAKTGSPPARG